MRCATVATIMLMIAADGRSADKVIDHWITETTLFRGLAIPPSEFSLTRVKGLATKLFAATSSRKLISLWVVPDGPDANRGAVGATDIDPFKLWRSQYDWMVNYTRPAALATMIDQNAVLQFRDKQGTESRIILAGSDPLVFHSDHIRYEIMGIHRQGREAHPAIDLLVKTDVAVDEDTGKRLTREYLARLGLPFLAVVFRTDCWFADEWFYPTFKGCGPPPSEEEFRKAPLLRCISSRGEMRCSAR